MIEALKRLLLGLSKVERLENELKLTRAALELARKQRDQWQADCKSDWNDRMRVILDLEAQLQTARRTAALHRSLISILREVNRDLDERLAALESGKAAPPEAEAEA